MLLDRGIQYGAGRSGSSLGHGEYSSLRRPRTSLLFLLCAPQYSNNPHGPYSLRDHNATPCARRSPGRALCIGTFFFNICPVNLYPCRVKEPSASCGLYLVIRADKTFWFQVKLLTQPQIGRNGSGG